ncbi:hypothetical protein [Propionivibrio limicola]|uniref:hypothetical protein n=1 Tax=Propionivibrio limicola TaxID=167645 RepID=UPI001291ABF1|nr:hypothetical protein [Propionivibrio limicola]
MGVTSRVIPAAEKRCANFTNSAGAVSEQARRAVDLVFTNAARSALCLGPGDTIEIARLPGEQFIEPPASKIVVLTIASYLFRLLTIFHVEDDQAGEDYFLRGEAATAGRAFLDVFAELGNMCCGAMNRELGRHFPHTGMSTPYVLDRHCLPFVRELKPAYLSQHRLQINDGVTLHATLCLCAYGDLDFRIDPVAPVEATGELELF